MNRNTRLTLSEVWEDLNYCNHIREKTGLEVKRLVEGQDGYTPYDKFSESYRYERYLLVKDDVHVGEAFAQGWGGEDPNIDYYFYGDFKYASMPHDWRPLFYQEFGGIWSELEVDGLENV